MHNNRGFIFCSLFLSFGMNRDAAALSRSELAQVELGYSQTKS